MTESIQIPIASPRLSPDDIRAVEAILLSGQLVCGPEVERFEKALGSYLGVRHVICVSSGTAALHVGLLSLGIGAGDDVIVPAFSFPATANTVELVGARPIFVDSEPGGFNIDATKIENHITPSTKAIMAAHNFGYPAKMGQIVDIARKYRLTVFEDAACALGSNHKGVRCGAIGDMAAFSFHQRKILTTGEGGAIATNDIDLAQRSIELRNHGQRAGVPGEFVSVGFNYRMTDIQGALGFSQLKRYSSILFRRKKAARYYLARIRFLKQIQPVFETHAANCQSFAAFVAEGRRDQLIEHLRVNGIGASIGTYSIPHTTYYRKRYGYQDSDYPNSLHAFRNLISLPLFDGITHKEQDSVIDAIAGFGARQSQRRKAEAVVV